jgi:hypothetical protein
MPGFCRLKSEDMLWKWWECRKLLFSITNKCYSRKHCNLSCLGIFSLEIHVLCTWRNSLVWRRLPYSLSKWTFSSLFKTHWSLVLSVYSLEDPPVIGQLAPAKCDSRHTELAVHLTHAWTSPVPPCPPLAPPPKVTCHGGGRAEACHTWFWFWLWWCTVNWAGVAGVDLKLMPFSQNFWNPVPLVVLFEW